MQKFYANLFLGLLIVFFFRYGLMSAMLILFTWETQ